ncbi:hypothetical protein [Natronorubrum aibiense]|uniref:Glycosyltransferase RgtA/B/C/D-like domain-containing protein n=1 Tax=Natronorubrum aibiense TaxID=348826 RepID=A0A5P9P363_9EURY|nr:hypothetical protein [Natronorubrum aibiense]QFU82290.1 hypothetical protein GCU68_06970 [Natronorubrum aibiense]
MNVSLEKVIQTQLPAIGIFSIGLVGMIISTKITNPYTIVLSPAITLAAVVYFISSDRPELSISIRIPVRLVITCLFLLIAVSIVLFQDAGYTRTTAIHGSIIALYGVVLLLFLSDSSDIISLGGLCIVGILHRVQIYYSSAIQIGIDSLYHNRVAGEIASAGTLAPLAPSQYWFAPFYHILTATGSHILNLPIRATAFVISGVALVLVPTVLVYSITVRYWSSQVGLLAGFLYSISDYTISWSVMPVSTTLGTIFFTMTIYSFLQFTQTNSDRFLMLVISSVIALMFSHQISFFITFVTIFVFYISYLAITDYSPIRTSYVTLIVGCLIILDWLVTRFGINSDLSFLQTLVIRFVANIQNAGSRSAVLPDFENAVLGGSNALTIEHTIGVGLLTGLGILGGLTWLRANTRRSLMIAIPLGMALGTLFAFSFGGPIVGLNFLIPRRWFIFIYIILSIFAAVGVYAAISTVPRVFPEYIKTGLFIIGVLTVVVFMSFNFMGALDDPVFDAPGAERYAMTSAENHAYTSAIEYQGDRTIVGDNLAVRIIDRHYDDKAEIYTYYPDGGELNPNIDRIYIHRSYVTTDSNAYYMRYDSRTFGVHGPLPKPAGDVVYNNDEAKLITSN